jgi:DNA-directed RNA polymerase specialized sigma24 family protein
VPEPNLVEMYVDFCEGLSLNHAQRERFWRDICDEIERVEAALPHPESATPQEIETACERVQVRRIEELALALHWQLVTQVVERSRWKLGADEEEGDTVESRVKLKLYANDFEVLRSFRRESSFPLYLKTIVQRTFHDLRVERFGKWHHSAAAERLGPLAKNLERLIYRDGHTQSEAISVVMTSHPEVSRGTLEKMLEELPIKQRRPAKVSMEDLEDLVSTDPESDVLIMTGERFRLSERAAAAVREFMQALEDSDRQLLQYFFERNLKISTIAQMLMRDQKSLYRHRDDLLAQLRAKLESLGIRREDAADLYRHIAKIADFGFEKKGK